MSPTVKNLHDSQSGTENISILLVSPHKEDMANLRNILHHRDWSITHCTNAAEARRHFGDGPHSIVVTERDLPDGNWRDILHECESQQEPALVLVMSRSADDSLWAEVLNLGGYDVLLKPLDKSEVTRVVGMAWRCWFNAFRHSVSRRLVPQFA